MQPGDVVGGRFVLERIAGTGGMGSVFRGHDRATRAPVAIKVLAQHDAEAIRRFDHEAKILAELGHPHIVRYVAHGADPAGAPWLVMEWLEGRSLASRLVEGHLTQAEAVGLGIRVASALAAAHARGIVHRDVKPSNVFLVGGVPEAAKVLDFGLAQAASNGARLTRTGSVLGTPGYMAPEQAQGLRGRVHARADVFSLGALLFECLTGKPAFEGEGVMAILARLLLEDAPRVRSIQPEIPRALDTLVARMLSRVAEARPADGAEVLRALEGIDAVGGERISVVPALPEGISDREHRLVCAIVAAPAVEAAIRPSSPTLRTQLPRSSWDDVRVIARRHGASPAELASGTLLLSLDGSADGPVRAARCALEIADLLLGFRVALVTGRSDARRDLPAPEVVERALDLLKRASRAPAFGVRIDDRTQALLPARFEIEGPADDGRLRRERDDLGKPCPLLGQPCVFTGRKGELAVVLDLLEEGLDEPRASAALVVAPAGLGKTRLAQEVVRALQASRPDLVVGFARPGSSSAEFGMIEPAIRALATSPDAGAAVRFEDRAIDVLRARAEAGPLLLVLDEVQWADAASLALVDQALGELSDRPIGVLALARPEVRDRAPGLFARRSVQEIRLGTLSQRAAREFLRRALGPDMDDEALAALAQRSEGHPLFLQELARGAEGVTPEALLAVHGPAIAELVPAARRLLRAAAFVGVTFWEGAVVTLLGGDTDVTQVRSMLCDLAKREIITKRRTSSAPNDTEYAFSQPMLREAFLATSTEADLRRGQALAERWLAGSGVRPTAHAGSEGDAALALARKQGGARS
ncbi:serine/threonine-protein kinase [Polyangium fumosum]|uniref:Serine/threonine-protein kinase PknK n=1 Tax=Polyangium fumosum TaxID=889272 RepID=A0A4U1IZF0_9BACT|nr:serine/threonine-protein kinase [Polyangium fumosum]TKD00098.1 serine/threonine-protein kinase PknK [Polyangium fumosum]